MLFGSVEASGLRARLSCMHARLAWMLITAHQRRGQKVQPEDSHIPGMIHSSALLCLLGARPSWCVGFLYQITHHNPKPHQTTLPSLQTSHGRIWLFLFQMSETGNTETYNNFPGLFANLQPLPQTHWHAWGGVAGRGWDGLGRRACTACAGLVISNILLRSAPFSESTKAAQ